MPAEIFPPAGWADMGTPDWGLADKAQADIEETKLGDGYVFRQARGLNFIRSAFSPTWPNLPPALGQQAYDWLNLRRKLVPIRWRHPIRDTYIQVTIEDVTITWDEYNNAVLSLELQQDFNPV